MIVSMDLKKQILKIDGEEIVCEHLTRDKNAVILHGAGTSRRERFYSIARELADHGIGIVLFDFSGHGQSTGKLSEQTLERRRNQAQAVINSIIPQGKLYLLGFSMGAQTLCDILPVYKDRLEAVLLACPAIYTEEARNIVFGNDQFTSKLREEKSWENSIAPGLLKQFKGRTVIAIGDKDEVIPKGVVELLKNSANSPIYKEYPGATHMFAKWLDDHPGELSELVEQLVL